MSSVPTTGAGQSAALPRFTCADPARVPSTTITVRHGDTLEALARTYGTTIAQLAKLNPDVQNLDDPRIGQQLKVPFNRQVARR